MLQQVAGPVKVEIFQFFFNFFFFPASRLRPEFDALGNESLTFVSEA
jgi:hypothetical protein